MTFTLYRGNTPLEPSKKPLGTEMFDRHGPLAFRRCGPVTLVLSGFNARCLLSKICHGKPVIRGTRMPVALVVGSLER